MRLRRSKLALCASGVHRMHRSTLILAHSKHSTLVKRTQAYRSPVSLNPSESRQPDSLLYFYPNKILQF